MLPHAVLEEREKTKEGGASEGSTKKRSDRLPRDPPRDRPRNASEHAPTSHKTFSVHMRPSAACQSSVHGSGGEVLSEGIPNRLGRSRESRALEANLVARIKQTRSFPREDSGHESVEVWVASKRQAG